MEQKKKLLKKKNIYIYKQTKYTIYKYKWCTSKIKKLNKYCNSPRNPQPLQRKQNLMAPRHEYQTTPGYTETDSQEEEALVF